MRSEARMTSYVCCISLLHSFINLKKKSITSAASAHNKRHTQTINNESKDCAEYYTVLCVLLLLIISIA